MPESTELLKAVFQVGLLLHHLNQEAEERTGLSIVQWTVLRHVGEAPGISAQGLARAVKVHPSTLTQTLKRLSRRGLIQVKGDREDSRKKRISLSAAGTRAVATADRELARMARDLGAIQQEIRAVEKGLRARA
ncbi:MAG TPA: MarR family transcriptional regulator [Bdellovibrionota bacterium]|jgi:DNA-binding MarR family transcriptional regulator|nr:MarR family transcriptional regulator [Bdellovibrionota bacterium]